MTAYPKVGNCPVNLTENALLVQVAIACPCVPSPSRFRHTLLQEHPCPEGEQH